MRFSVCCITNYLTTEREVLIGKSQPLILPSLVNTALSRFESFRKDITFEVNRVFIIWLCRPAIGPWI